MVHDALNEWMKQWWDRFHCKCEKTAMHLPRWLFDMGGKPPNLCSILLLCSSSFIFQVEEASLQAAYHSSRPGHPETYSGQYNHAFSSCQSGWHWGPKVCRSYATAASSSRSKPASPPFRGEHDWLGILGVAIGLEDVLRILSRRDASWTKFVWRSNKPHHDRVTSPRGDEIQAFRSNDDDEFRAISGFQGFWYILESISFSPGGSTAKEAKAKMKIVLRLTEILHNESRTQSREAVAKLHNDCTLLDERYDLFAFVHSKMMSYYLHLDRVGAKYNIPAELTREISLFLSLLLWMRVYTSVSRISWMKLCRIRWEMLPRATISTSRGSTCTFEVLLAGSNKCWALARIGVLSIVTFVCLLGIGYTNGIPLILSYALSEA